MSPFFILPGGNQPSSNPVHLANGRRSRDYFMFVRALAESYRAVGLGTEVSDNIVETAVHYTAWWCAVIGDDIGS
ncbi:hypothetical protein K9B33_16445 [Sphingobium sp. 3R8]|uniref:hypothetical protein n=1 Tax=Sphingobium sp. 3R8 TaxID=2874921 RepID=UPI001CCA7FAE|nr:hypothetical protein [Sphingobium sp. 3R8]MBZ9649130.1 hypothetical protein [Sphingobium sp. 3R8]